MIRKLPTVDIGGTSFFVDVRLDEFRETSNPHNRIPFAALWDKEDHYILLYDKQTKNVMAETPNENKMPPHVERIRIPLLTELDPVGIRNLFKSVAKKEQKQHKIRKGPHL
jgi:hypothetical protein